MPSLIRHFWPCLEVIRQSVNDRKKITYGELAGKLGLESAQQQWNTVLNPVAAKTKDELGDDYDLTWDVVYATGSAKGLGRYFSNDGKATGSTLLNPKDRNQVADYERTLKKIYQYTYEWQKIGGKDTLIKVATK
jgi:hypothetical protein